MGILVDIFNGLPLNIIQKQKLEAQEKRLADLERENGLLREKLARYEDSPGEKCPSCRKPCFSLKSSKPDAVYGDMGLSDYLFSCGACGYEDTVSAESAGRAWSTVRG